MNRKKLALAGATAAALVLAGGGVAIAGGVGDDDAAERPIPGPALQQAEDAALAETGGGEVTGTEVERRGELLRGGGHPGRRRRRWTSSSTRTSPSSAPSPSAVTRSPATDD